VATGDAVRLRLHFECARRQVLTPVVMTSTPEGLRVLAFGTQASAGQQLECEAGPHRVDVLVPNLPLSAGMHVLGASLRLQGYGLAHEVEYAGEFEVSPRDVYGSGRPPMVRGSLIALPHSWDVPADDAGMHVIE
jgi:hypothetical protein